MSHLITYHRYLCVSMFFFVHWFSHIPRRFYPNGQVISLLANEEHEPQHVITILRPTLRMKVRANLVSSYIMPICLRVFTLAPGN